jgi:N-acetylmuramoyl-L-alanine amidase
VSQDGDHLTVKFEADALDIANPPLPSQGAQSLVQAVRIGEPTTLIVDLGPRFAGFRAASQPVDAAMRQVIDFIAAQTDTQAQPQQPPPATTPAPPPDLPPAFSPPVPTLRTIVVDPGHGGDDEGAKGETIKEKDLAMTVARRLKAAIEGRLGVRVLLTRDDDRLVPIDDRAALANNNKADLFISLHANASMRRSASGATIYSAAFDSNAAAQAPGERVPTFGGGLRDIDLVPWDLAQTRHIDESTMFAGLLERTFRDHVPLANRAVDRAPLRVLQSANMPAVLVEMGYVTNPEQEKLLSGDSFQNALVQSVYDAIVRFRDAIAGGTR